MKQKGKRKHYEMRIKREGRGILRNEGRGKVKGRENRWEDKSEMKDAKLRDLRN